MLKNFKLTVEYDGGAYHGWQRQKSDATIQGKIEQALAKMTKRPIVLIGAGRTDAGTHAYGQVANFKLDTRLTPATFQKGLNSLLPDDIVITACTPVDLSFHARYDVSSKIYIYRILNRPLPAAVGRRYAWFIPQALNLEAMKKTLPCLVGSHDFKAFEGAGSPRSHTVRRVLNAGIVEQDNGYIVFEIEANGFLRYMVRNIVGTLVLVGREKLSPEDFVDILESKERDNAGPTAPSHGLFLEEVRY
jgi:tRNA pseudouridine38-40 synthase